MGLDMYLKGKRYLSEWSTGAEVKKKIVPLFPEISPVLETVQANGIEVVITVGYWRKANAIHKWFVDNCQEGKDECQETNISRDQLVELKQACHRVIHNPSEAGELLPTALGFLFGSTDYDEGYIQDLKDTVQIIDEVLQLPTDWDIYYRASW